MNSWLGFQEGYVVPSLRSCKRLNERQADANDIGSALLKELTDEDLNS
jgi:hypothetical protein